MRHGVALVGQAHARQQRLGVQHAGTLGRLEQLRRPLRSAAQQFRSAHGRVGSHKDRLDEVLRLRDSRGDGQARRREQRPQDARPPQRKPQVGGAREVQPRGDVEGVDVEIGLIETVEDDEPLGAGVDQTSLPSAGLSA